MTSMLLARALFHVSILNFVLESDDRRWLINALTVLADCSPQSPPNPLDVLRWKDLSIRVALELIEGLRVKYPLI